MNKAIGIAEQRTLLIGAARSIATEVAAKKEVPADATLDSLFDQIAPDGRVFSKFAGPDAAEIPDAEVARAYASVARLYGSPEKAATALRALAETPSSIDFAWKPSVPAWKPLPTAVGSSDQGASWWGGLNDKVAQDVGAPSETAFVGSRYDDNAERRIFLKAQIVGLHRTLPHMTGGSVYGMKNFSLRSSTIASPAQDGFAGPAGSGELRRYDFSYETAAGKKAEGSYWVETADDKPVNGGWLSKVPEDLFWFGSMSVLLEEGSLGFKVD